MTGANVIGPTGAPPGISIDLPVNPNDGDALTLTFNLPDGTTQQLTMTATTASPPGANAFTIGATPAATAANLQAALTSSIRTLAATQLTAASALEAAHNFFDVGPGQPAQRVAGPPFATATALVNATPADTVSWYTGAMSANPRASVTARIDFSATVSYGLQANEQGLRSVIENVAVFAATNFQVGNPNSNAAYVALAQRVGLGLFPKPGQQNTGDIEAELANAQISIKTATSQQKQTQALQNFGAGHNRGIERAGRRRAVDRAGAAAGLAADHRDAVEAEPAELSRTGLIRFARLAGSLQQPRRRRGAIILARGAGPPGLECFQIRWVARRLRSFVAGIFGG